MCDGEQGASNWLTVLPVKKVDFHILTNNLSGMPYVYDIISRSFTLCLCCLIYGKPCTVMSKRGGGGG